jgi:integrase
VSVSFTQWHSASSSLARVRVPSRQATHTGPSIAFTSMVGGPSAAGADGAGIARREGACRCPRLASRIAPAQPQRDRAGRAVHRRLVVFNVAAPVKCPSQVKTKRIPWSPEEVRAFLASLAGDRLHAPMLLSLIGMRPEEVCGLRWTEDVDLDQETLTISNVRTLTWTEHGGQVVEKGPKTEAGERTLPLPRRSSRRSAGSRRRRPLSGSPQARRTSPPGTYWSTSSARRSRPISYAAPLTG